MNYVVNNGQLVCYKTRPSSRAKDTSGIRFQLLSSKPGFHIVPVEAHDSTGKSVLMPSLLDQVITVPSEVRTASQHLRALVAAINKVQPIRLEYGPFGFRPDDVDKAFRAQPPVFQWGVHSTVTRDALIDLLNQSATSMPWHLMCQASAQASDRNCTLNISVIQVLTTDSHGNTEKRPIFFDRGR